tara:strand:- start:565 stop:738 length:174 start_codon:yes stop_codon:yes gene_type:complete
MFGLIYYLQLVMKIWIAKLERGMFSHMNNESVRDYAKQRRSNINAKAKESNLFKFLH